MNSEYILVIVAIIGGPLVAYITSRSSRPKVIADAQKTYNDISLSLVEPQKRRMDAMQTQIMHLETKVERLEAENAALHTWAQLLYTQVVEAGDTPIPFDSEFLPGGHDE